MTNNTEKGRSFEKIERMKKLYPKMDDLLAARDYYLDQVDHSLVDPVNWQKEVLTEAIDVFEMVLAAHPGEPERPLSVNHDSDAEDIDQRNHAALALYQLKVILAQKTAH